MRVRCLSIYPIEADIAKLGGFYRRQSFRVTVGSEYLVLGLMFVMNSNLFGTGLVVRFVDDDGNFAFAPLFMFEIVNGSPSKYWMARFHEDGTFELQPPSFYKEYYDDDLSEGVPEIVADFRRVMGLLEAEASAGSEGELRENNDSTREEENHGTRP